MLSMLGYNNISRPAHYPLHKIWRSRSQLPGLTPMHAGIAVALRLALRLHFRDSDMAIPITKLSHLVYLREIQI